MEIKSCFTCTSHAGSEPCIHFTDYSNWYNEEFITPVKSEPKKTFDAKTFMFTALLFFVIGSITDNAINERKNFAKTYQIQALKLESVKKSIKIRNLVNWKVIENTGTGSKIRKEINSKKNKRLSEK